MSSLPFPFGVPSTDLSQSTSMNVSDLLYDLKGLINDAMGHLRDGDYEMAEHLMEVTAMKLVDQLPEPDKTLEMINILRKLSVVYEYQDRVDDCHEAWEQANVLEKLPKFGANPHRGWKLSPPPSPSNKRKDNNGDGGHNNNALAGTVAHNLTRAELTAGVQKANQQLEQKQMLHETCVAANERYIASVLAMAREDSTYSQVRRVLTAGSTGHSKPTKDAPAKTADSTSTAHSKARKNTTNKKQATTTTTTTTTTAKKRKRKKNTHKKTNGKTQTIDELKKLIKQDPTIAGVCALKMARKYTHIKQPKKAMQSYKTALVKEARNFDSIEYEQEDLIKNWKSIRGLKEKREAEELKVQLALDWVKSEKIILASHVGLIKLLLRSPIAALNSEIIVATMPSQIQEASAWFPSPPKNTIDLQAMYCAASSIEDQCRQWTARFPIATRPGLRRPVLHQLIDMLNGCVTGPLGDLFGETIEELLETEIDADNLKLLDSGGVYYSRRRHFRRANELMVRSEALRRGETRAFAEPRRKQGEGLLTFGKHVDPSIDLYLASMPSTISGIKKVPKTKTTTRSIKNSKDVIRDIMKTTTASLQDSRQAMAEHGDSGAYGVATSDTWRGNLVNLVNPASDTLKDSFVVPTTVGRSVDERADSKYLLRSVGVKGQLVPTAGSSTLVTRLQMGDLKSRKISINKKNKNKVKWRDDLTEDRRRKGHTDMWQHHAAMTVEYPQGEISLQTYNSEGIPKRHWLEPSKKEIEAREKVLLAASTAGKLPPPKSAVALATRLNTAEERTLSTSALAKRFGSAGLGETQRLQTVSRARVFELPPPVRNPLQTPGTRSTLDSRGGMAFWLTDNDNMMNMQTLEVTDAPLSFPQQEEPVGREGVNDVQHATKKKTATKNKKPKRKKSDQQLLKNANALDFLERPPSTRPPSTLPGISKPGTAVSRRTISTANSSIGSR